MLKTKLYALASVTTLAGLVIAVTGSGCGNENTDAGAAAATGGSDKGAGSSGGSKDKSGTGDQAKKCPTEDLIDPAKLPWKAPKVSPNACTNSDLAKLVTYVESHGSATLADWKESVLSPICRDCIFSKNDEKWAPLVEDGSGGLDVLNVGGCVAIASGNEKCGKAYQNWVDCRLLACSTCPADGDVSVVQKCLNAANTGACKEAYGGVSTTCGDKVIEAAEKACEGSKFIFEGPIKAQCIGLGGLDGGVN